MMDGEIDVGRLAQLIRLTETRGLTELIVEEHGCRYVVRGSGRVPAPADVRDRNGASDSEENRAGSPAEASEPDRSGWIAVAAPMVGVFFRSPAPGEPPYVSLGDPVEQGQIIGLIEAMKVFSEVPSEHEGYVVELVAADGQLVHAGDPILFLAPGPINHQEDEQDGLHDG